MAITLSGVGTQNRINLGNATMLVGAVNLGTYATGGISCTPQMLGIGVIDIALFEFDYGTVDGIILKYNYSTEKIMAMVAVAGQGLVEINNLTDLSAYTARAVIIGI
jgi:hypothetical protein